MTINRITFCLIVILSLFAIYCAMVVGMTWDEPMHHFSGALRMDYLKSFGQFNKFKGGALQYYPGLYDTFSFVIVDFLLKIFPGKLVGIHHLINLTFSFLASPFSIIQNSNLLCSLLLVYLQIPLFKYFQLFVAKYRWIFEIIR